jgi:hypothetical protein
VVAVVEVDTLGIDLEEAVPLLPLGTWDFRGGNMRKTGSSSGPGSTPSDADFESG